MVLAAAGIHPTTGTGLDRLVTIILQDDGLRARIDPAEIHGGAAAANAMNEIIVEGIRALGIGNDGLITAADVRDLSDHIRTHHADKFIQLHGDDEDGVETGFHLVQGDGASGILFGSNAVNQVADGLYHLVFGYDGNNIINEDGNRNASLAKLAWWLNELLEDDLAQAAKGSGALASDADPLAVSRTGTGLDQLIDIIVQDPGLSHRISTSQIRDGAQAASDINAIIIDIIRDRGLANDGRISAADVYEINAAIRSDAVLLQKFMALHGDDDGDTESGFHLVQGDGASARLYAANAVNTVADGLYHIGFGIEKGRFLNEDGDRNASVTTVAAWLDNLLDPDLAQGALVNLSVDPLPGGATGTGLDVLVDIIETDIGLDRKIAVSDIAGGAQAANILNQLLLDGLFATGAANDGRITAADMRDVNTWLRSDAGRLAEFIDAHGDDEDGVETGFHLVQDDGAVARLYGENAVNTVADGIYHFGFDIDGGRFLNEDGARNQTVEDVAAWIDGLLSDSDMGALANGAVMSFVTGTTGTGLDALVDIVNADPGLELRIATSQIAGGAAAADGLNALVLEGIRAVGAADDGVITGIDLHDVNQWIRADAARLASFVALHGNDEAGVETGFHLIQDDGSRTTLFGRSAIDTVMDGIYHIGFEIEGGRFLNEDGNRNASVDQVAFWLNELLKDDLVSGVLRNPDADPLNVDLDALAAHIVFVHEGDVDVDNGTGYVVTGHQDQLQLEAGTLVFDFTADTPEDGGRDVLFSKDGSGFGAGGDTTIWVERNDIHIRFQTDSESVYLKARDVVEPGSTHALAFSFDGKEATLYLDGVRLDAEAASATWEGNDREIGIGVNIWARSASRPDWTADPHDGRVSNVTVFDKALSSAEIQAFTGAVPQATALAGAPAASASLPAGSTGTGLDAVIDVIVHDVGLARRLPPEEVAGGAAAADGMNHIIVEAIRATGLGNDGRLTADDVRDLSDWIADNRADAFIAFHGDDEEGIETGFHRVQSDGAQTRMYGDNAVNTVFDGIYHLVFGYEGRNIINEDGNRNASLEDIAWWLDSLLSEDLDAAANGTGALFNADADPLAVATTGTGLDLLAGIVFDDPGIERNVATSGQVEGIDAGMAISRLILDGIATYGLADDGTITASDVLAINQWIRSDPTRIDAFVAAHGDDEDGVETGYHLLQNDGGQTLLFGENALDTVFDGIFHIGFEVENGRFLNEDGNRNASVQTVAYWLDELLAADLQAGTLATGNAPSPGGTGTGLDHLVSVIMDDPGLEARISEFDIRGGAEAANELNALIVEAIIGTGVAVNGTIRTADIHEINRYIREDAARFDAFMAAHGDDANDVETGFHLVRKDGATTLLYGSNAIDSVADGLYHIGFEIRGDRLLNEDGNANASLQTVAGWLDSLLSETDMAALAAASTVNPYVHGSSGTGLDILVDTITDDDRLQQRISTSDIRAGAEAADGLNAIILTAIKATGAANNGTISTFDIYDINQYIRSDTQTLALFTGLHGDDEEGAETGFHLVQGDGAVSELFGRNAVNTVADGIYHIGFEIDRGRFLNEDGDRNASVSTVADWLNGLLGQDLQDGVLRNEALTVGNVDLAALKAGQVFALDGPLTVSRSGGYHEEVSAPAFALAEASVLVRFTPDDTDGDRDTLFSRDGYGYQDGGHLTMYVQGDDLVVRFQTTDRSHTLVARDSIAAGETHEAAFTFGGGVARLYLDGEIADLEETGANWLNADENLVFGGSTMNRTEDNDRIDSLFDGRIEAGLIFDSVLDGVAIQAAFTDDYAALSDFGIV